MAGIGASVGTALGDALVRMPGPSGESAASAQTELRDAVKAAALEYLNNKGDAQVAKVADRLRLVLAVVGGAAAYALLRTGARR